jgi:hypothetical protein
LALLEPKNRIGRFEERLALGIEPSRRLPSFLDLAQEGRELREERDEPGQGLGFEARQVQ